MKLYRFPLFLAVLIVLATLAGAAEAQTAPADPTGFVAMLNQARAARGLAPVAYDATAAATAAQNNAAQAAYGLGHHVVGPYGQVAAVGMADARAALDAWCGSPAHASIIFAPDLIAVGFHQLGNVATASTRQGYPSAPAFQPVQWTYPATRWPATYPVRWTWVR